MNDSHRTPVLVRRALAERTRPLGGRANSQPPPGDGFRG